MVVDLFETFIYVPPIDGDTDTRNIRTFDLAWHWDHSTYPLVVVIDGYILNYPFFHESVEFRFYCR